MHTLMYLSLSHFPDKSELSNCRFISILTCSEPMPPISSVENSSYRPPFRPATQIFVGRSLSLVPSITITVQCFI